MKFDTSPKRLRNSSKSPPLIGLRNSVQVNQNKMLPNINLTQASVQMEAAGTKTSLMILNPTPDHLSNLCFNRDKIEFFTRATKIVNKL